MGKVHLINENKLNMFMKIKGECYSQLLFSAPFTHPLAGVLLGCLVFVVVVVAAASEA